MRRSAKVMPGAALLILLVNAIIFMVLGYRIDRLYFKMKKTIREYYQK